MVLEAHSIDFQFIGENWRAVDVVPTSHHLELSNFGSYLGAIGNGLMCGQFMDAVMAGCRGVDGAIARFTTAHSAEVKAKKIPLRHDIFAAAYTWGRRAAISKLVSFVHSGGLSFCRDEKPGFGPAIRDAWKRAETAGEFYCLIAMTRLTAHDTVAAPYVAKLLKNIKILPYHLQLGLIDFAGHLRKTDELVRTDIVQALQDTLDKLGPMMNTIIFEALNGLGALEDEANNYVSVVQSEIQSVLGGDGPDADSEAWRLFSCQFDHPYDVAYWDEIQGLDEVRKKRLLIKACRGADGRVPFFLGTLIRQLCDFRDPDVAPTIARWTGLPDKTSCIPQEAVEVYFRAHEALGVLQAELPISRGEASSEADKAMFACGELFYWAGRADAENAEASHDTLIARSTLLEGCRNTAIGALQLTTSWMLSDDGTRVSLVKKYPTLAAEICRRGLERRDTQISYFENGFNSDLSGITCFAINVLGEIGATEDLPVLRDLCDDEQCGTSALRAIKSIEERHRFRYN